MLLLATGVAAAQLTAEPVGGGMYVTASPDLNGRVAAPSSAASLTTVYNNIGVTPNLGFADGDLNAELGDQLFTQNTGLLSEQRFTIFNGVTSLGPLLTATVSLRFYNGFTMGLIGTYATSVNLGAGLAPGSFAVVDVAGLDAMNIVFGTTNVIATQRTVSFTGTATRLGIASFSVPIVGASPSSMFVSDSGNPAGMYTVGAGVANPGYALLVTALPVPVRATTWGTIQRLYR